MAGVFERILGRVNPLTGAPTGRVVALDLARGLAILGMFTAHMWVSSTGEMPDLPAGFFVGLTHGRCAPLFALLAGVSLGIIGESHSRREALAKPDSPRQVLLSLRIKLLLRACFLLLIAAILTLFNQRILLILDNYGIWFLAMIPLLGLRTRTLIGIAVCNLLVGAPLFHYLQNLSLPYLASNTLGLRDYLFPVYLTYVLSGLILWRLGWTKRRCLARCLAFWGGGIAATALALGTLLDSWRLGRVSLAWLGMEPHNSLYSVSEFANGETVQYADYNLLTPGSWQFWYDSYLYIAPHADSALEAVANLGWSVALVSILLLVPAQTHRFFAPIAALGSMALTAYTLHIVWHAISWKLFGLGGLFPSFVLMVVVFLTLASLWRLRFRRGPLEGLFHWIITLA